MSYDALSGRGDPQTWLKYKSEPFVKKKSVVHKSEFDNCQLIEKQLSLSGKLQSGLIPKLSDLKKKIAQSIRKL